MQTHSHTTLKMPILILFVLAIGSGGPAFGNASPVGVVDPAQAPAALPIGTNADPQEDLFSLQWKDTYQSGNNPTIARAATVDLEGNIIVVGDVSAGSFKALVLKYDITDDGNNGNAPLWSREYNPTGGTDRNFAVVTDLESNIFVAGVLTNSDSHASGSAAVTRYSPTGDRNWARVVGQPLTGPVPGVVQAIAVDADGVVYVGGTETIDDAPSFFIARLDPALGDTLWVRRFSGDPDATAVELNDLAVDADANVYFTGLNEVSGGRINAVTARLTPDTGEVVWVETYDNSPWDAMNAIDIDPNGDVIVGGLSEDGSGDTRFRVLKYDATDGTLLWQSGHDAGNSIDSIDDLVVDREGNIYVTGSSSASSNYTTVKYDNGGNKLWNQNYGGVTITLDSLGNPYVAGDPDDDIIKLNPDDGARIWTATPGAAIFDMVVDPSGGVFVAGQKGLSAFAARYTQLFLSAPRTYTGTPHAKAKNQSNWKPNATPVDYENDFITWSFDFSPSFSKSFQAAGLDFGATLDLRFEGTISLGVKADMSGGTFDLSMPVITNLYLAEDELGPGVDLLGTTDWVVDPSASLTGNDEADFDFGFTGGFYDGRVSAELSVTAFSQELGSAELFDERFDLGPDYLYGLQMYAALIWPQFIPTAEWGTRSDQAFGTYTVTLQVPRFLAAGKVEDTVLRSSVNEHFMDLELYVTQAIMRLISGGTGFNRQVFKGEVAGAKVDVDLAVDDLITNLDLFLDQDLTITPGGTVTLEFSDGLPSVEIPLGGSLEEGDVVLPNPWDGDLVITPTIHLVPNVQNVTNFRAIGKNTFRPLVYGATAKYRDYTLIDKSAKCWDCSSSSISYEPSPEMYDRNWDLPTVDVKLEPIVVTGPTHPELAAASRSSVDMIIYDQISPNQSFFNGRVNKVTKLLLYGQLLTDDAVAYISHQGREEALATTWLNNRTLLVEIPNRLRLLPGMATIWVESDLGLSNSLDFPIQFPKPRLATINPNLWAADPDLATIPVSVIDAETTAGLQTYIARRDYFLLLRDELWNFSTAGGMSAEEYFSEFDFEGLPPFPLVLLDGEAMPRFVQPVDNGIHNLRVAPSVFEAPEAIEALLINPPPGGGPSNPVTLHVAAPVPVMNTLLPAWTTPDPNYDPDDQPFILKVQGPAHVPYWPGYEEPKYGNFNAASVVRWDGVDLVTSFNSSYELKAEVPRDLLAMPGNHNITVYTPANGTQYFEELYDGSDNLVFQGLVDSGGESAPMVFAVLYDQPTVTALTPSTIGQCSLAFEGAPTYNLAVTGSGLAPGALVHINGDVRDTQWVSDTMLRAALLPTDVDDVNTLQVLVSNPAPGGGASESFTISVVEEDCDANGVSDQCDIAAGTALDCNGNATPDSCDIANGTSEDLNENGIPDECD
jgi:hypothetical protein